MGAGDEDRTRDLFLGRETLYQLSYSRLSRGGEIRTHDPSVPNRVRYHCATPREWAEGESNSHGSLSYQRILSPSRLPIPPSALVAAGLGFEPRLKAPRASVLPLDDPALERVMGIEPTLFSLATRRFTTKLHPLGAEGRSRTAISCFSDTRRHHVGYLGSYDYFTKNS